MTATVPSSSYRRAKRTAELGLTSKCAAAWRRDMPEATFFTTRIRKSCEIAMLNPPERESNHGSRNIQSEKDKFDSLTVGTALERPAVLVFRL